MSEPTMPGRKAPRRSNIARRLAINTVSNWAVMVADAVIRLFLLAFLFRHLGREDYGLYQVSLSITHMTMFLQFGMSGSVMRYGAEGIVSKDWERLSDTLSVVRTLTTIAGALAFGMAVVASLFMLNVLKVPQESHAAATVLIQLTGLNAACNLLSISYTGVLRAKQRYDLVNGILLGEHLLRVVLFVLFFGMGYVGLRVAGLCLVLPSVVSLVVMTIVVRQQLPHMRLSYRRFSGVRCREVFAFSGWLAVTRVAQAAFSQMGAPLVSATVGVGAVPLLAIPRQMAGQMMKIILGFTQPLRPVATTFAVQGRRDRLADLYKTSLRLSTAMMVPAIVALLVYGKPVIRYLTSAALEREAFPVLVVYTVLFAFTPLGIPANSLILAVGRIRGIAVWRAAALLSGVGLAFASAALTDWGIIGIVVALNAPSAIYSLLYLPYRAWQETGVNIPASLITCVLPATVTAVMPLVAGLAMQWAWPPNSIWITLLQMVLSALPYVPVAWFLVLTRQEREIVLRIFRQGAQGRSPGPPPPPEQEE